MSASPGRIGQTGGQGFTGELVNLIDSIRRDKEQTIDHLNLDTLRFSGWATDAQTAAEHLTQEFADYLASHKDQIEALSILRPTPTPP